MKRILIFFISINLISKTTFANVPLDQCFDLYHNTKDEYKDISPAWAEIMLHSGQLKGIRLFGDFKSIKHQDFKPHPAFAATQEKLNYNAPQDAISALLQYLFPSPNGQFFAINQRKKDPVGKLSKKNNIHLINNLIEAIYKYKTNSNALEEMLIEEKKIYTKRTIN
jgi:hypothetical protein